MDLKIDQLQRRLIKYYFIVPANTTIIIEGEIDFIEDCFNNTEMSIDEVAKELISIYMVA